MSGSFLLDTNIVIALLEDEPGIRAHVADAGEILVSEIVIGELYFGAFKSRQVEENVARIDKVVATSAILELDTTTARHYGQLKARLRAIGQPIPENDLWIAASAVQHDLTLVTRDQHFEAVPDLIRVRW